MKIIIGSDHAGFMLKDQIKKYLADKKINVIDKGSFNEASVDYPDYAALVAKEVQASGQIGILFCGTGLGVAMAANKFKGIRAAPCRTPYEAEMARQHNDANVLCIGGRTTSIADATQIIDKFLSTDASSEERHVRRIEKIKALEKNMFK